MSAFNLETREEIEGRGVRIDHSGHFDEHLLEGVEQQSVSCLDARVYGRRRDETDDAAEFLDAAWTAAAPGGGPPLDQPSAALARPPETPGQARPHGGRGKDETKRRAH